MSANITLQVNGRKQQIYEGTTVAQLLTQRSVNPDAVVVEVNLDIIPRETYQSQRLSPGDTVEILHFVGGG